MTAIAYFSLSPVHASQRHSALVAAGMLTPGMLQCNKLVHEVMRCAPDQVIFHLEMLDELARDDALRAQLIEVQAKCPVVLWLEQTPLPLAAVAALDWGVQDILLGEVVADKLRLTLAMAQARWRQHRVEKERLMQMQAQLSERKWVERAKGVLMQAQGLDEDEAFRMLRGAAMQAKLQVGEVSRSVIEAAQWAQATNRSGQLRMLSQRMVKLALQRHLGIDAKRAHDMQADAAQRIEDNLAFLAAVHDNTSTAGSSLAVTIGPSLKGVQDAWVALRTALALGGSRPRKADALALRLADERAEALLQSSESLTKALASTAGRTGLRVVNLCGRQRMRVQRLAKQALLARLVSAPVDVSLEETARDFEHSLNDLDAAPLSSAEIRALLQTARAQWLHLLRALRAIASADSLPTVCGTSESLLETFDRLTACYEHSLQLIFG
jgi:AmiR/NasT family two-component response regulator